jgi:hypothetical protein
MENLHIQPSHSSLSRRVAWASVVRVLLLAAIRGSLWQCLYSLNALTVLDTEKEPQ